MNIHVYSSSHKLNKYRFNLTSNEQKEPTKQQQFAFFLSDFWDKRVHFFGASFRAIIFSLDRLCNERLFAPFVRLLSFNSVVKQKSAAAVEKKQSYEMKSPPWTILWFRILGIFSVENILFSVADYCLKFETSKHPTYLYFQQSKGPPSKKAFKEGTWLHSFGKKDRLRLQASTIMIIRISSHTIQILLFVNCK